MPRYTKEQIATTKKMLQDLAAWYQVHCGFIYTTHTLLNADLEIDTAETFLVSGKWTAEKEV